MTEVERWLPVVGFEGYEVSDHGRVRGLDRLDAAGRRRTGQMLKPGPKRGGYRHVVLFSGGRGYDRCVHTLVLEAFVGPCPEGMEACHDPDWDTANNRLTNLRWDTRSANAYDRIRHGRHNRAGRTHCPRAHPLTAPNLRVSAWRRGIRNCLACGRAFNYLRDHPDEDMQTVSDRYYAQIIAAAQSAA